MNTTKVRKSLTALEKLNNIVISDEYDQFIEVLTEMEGWEQEKYFSTKEGRAHRSKGEEEVWNNYVELHMGLFSAAEEVEFYRKPGKHGFISRGISKADQELVSNLCFAVENDDLGALEEVRDEINTAYEKKENKI